MISLCFHQQENILIWDIKQAKQTSQKDNGY
jgi:hypothetical protein